MRIVLDTNVLVSGLLNPDGTPGRIIDLLLGDLIEVLYDDRILGEYQDVLTRPELAIDRSFSQSIISYIRLSGERVTALPLAADTLTDPDDLPFAEVANSGGAEALGTGNLKHFSGLSEHGVLVLSPAQFLKRWT